MSYRQSPQFDAPTIEDAQKARQSAAWLVSVIVIQQGSMIFSARTSFHHWLGVAGWLSTSALVLAVLFGWRWTWMYRHDYERMTDEWHHRSADEACRWGFAAAIVAGFAIVATAHWLTLQASQAAYIVANAAMVTAGLRYAFLNRADPDEEA